MLTDIMLWHVYQQTGERSTQMLGLFATEELAKRVAEENPGWYNAPSTYGRHPLYVVQDYVEWQVIQENLAQRRR